MIRKDVVIRFVNGVEASPIALLVQTANRYSSSLYIETGDTRVNAKSIMGMLSVALNYGDTVRLVADGADEEAAIEALDKFLTRQ